MVQPAQHAKRAQRIAKGQQVENREEQSGAEQSRAEGTRDSPAAGDADARVAAQSDCGRDQAEDALDQADWALNVQRAACVYHNNKR